MINKLNLKEITKPYLHSFEKPFNTYDEVIHWIWDIQPVLTRHGINWINRRNSILLEEDYNFLRGFILDSIVDILRMINNSIKKGKWDKLDWDLRHWANYIYYAIQNGINKQQSKLWDKKNSIVNKDISNYTNEADLDIIPNPRLTKVYEILTTLKDTNQITEGDIRIYLSSFEKGTLLTKDQKKLVKTITETIKTLTI